MRQPSLAITVKFEIGAELDFERLDRELEHCFGCVDEDWADAGMDTQASSPGVGFAARALALYPVLAQACRMPCFETGRLLQVERLPGGPDQWRARLLLPAADLMPGALFEQLIEYSLVTLAQLATLEPTASARETLLQRLDRELARGLAGSVHGGTSTLPLCEAAHRLGLPLRHVGKGVVQLGWGSSAQLLDRSACLQDSGIGARLCTDKHGTAMQLRRAGLPAPVHMQVASLERARIAAKALGWPLVVKPADRERGAGVSIGIVDEVGLELAYHKARGYSPRVLVERQATGICHRILVADGEVVYAIKRCPKFVRGDGRHSVRELVEAGNRRQQQALPWLRRAPFPLDELAADCLRGIGLGFDDVPAPGRQVPLRAIESAEWGGESEDVTGLIHPDNAAAAIDAAALLGLRVAGIDMIAEDLGRPWHESGAIINEVNFAPLFGWNPATLERRAPFLRRLVRGDGRIPVCAVVGDGDLLSRGRAVQADWVRSGLRCHLTDSLRTEGPGGRTIALGSSGLYARCHALLARRDVDAIVMVLDTPEFLTTGLPVDRVNRIEREGRTETPAIRSLLRLLDGHAGKAETDGVCSQPASG
jgi:cyanophycin synthetase